MKFINREQELADLRKRLNSSKPELFIAYGKRRVGKTELIKQLIRHERAIYFLADKRTMTDQLRELARLLGEAFDDPFVSEQGFNDWLHVFQYLGRNVKDRFILVIDEFPYLTEVDAATGSLFQKGWDEYLRNTDIMMVLMGSSIAMMESETLIQKAPLFGRRTGQLLLQPLSFEQAWKFFPDKTFEEFLQVFSLTGGMPAYLLQVDGKRSIEANIVEYVFPKTAFLHNEVDFVLKEELREPKNYLSILRAIATGKRKMGEIVNETGIGKESVNKYIHTLIQLHIVERELPVTDKNPARSRKGLYRLNDNFFRFWFQFVFPYHSDIEINRYDEVLRKIREQFPLLTTVVYEEVCRSMLPQYTEHLFRLECTGKWWEGGQEIDIVGLNSRTGEIIFGEAKWSNKPVGTNIYESLKQKAKLVNWQNEGRKEYFALFSKSGFTEAMHKAAKQERILLIEQDCLLSYE